MINQNAMDEEFLLVWWDKSQILVRYCEMLP